jgi:hypothetical protein
MDHTARGARGAAAATCNAAAQSGREGHRDASHCVVSALRVGILIGRLLGRH